MENIATAILILLGIVVFVNYRNGSLRPWLEAKFLNKASVTA